MGLKLQCALTTLENEFLQRIEGLLLVENELVYLIGDSVCVEEVL